MKSRIVKYFGVIVKVVSVLTILIVFQETCAGSPKLSYRYRLKVELQTPDGLQTGESIIETRFQDNRGSNFGFVESRLLKISVKGQATAIKIGNRTLVAAMIVGPFGGRDAQFKTVVPETLGVRWSGPLDETRAAVEKAKREAVPREVPRDEWPTFIVFENQYDPATARVVHPDEIVEVFGRGYSVQSVKIDFTNDPINDNIDITFPWIKRNDAATVFYRALYTSGLRPNGMIGASTILKQGF